MKHKLTPAFVAKPPMPEPGKDRVTYWESNFGLMGHGEGPQVIRGVISRRWEILALVPEGGPEPSGGAPAS
jgi:hypothetical protein